MFSAWLAHRLSQPPNHATVCKSSHRQHIKTNASGCVSINLYFKKTGREPNLVIRSQLADCCSKAFSHCILTGLAENLLPSKQVSSTENGTCTVLKARETYRLYPSLQKPTARRQKQDTNTKWQKHCNAGEWRKNDDGIRPEAQLSSETWWWTLPRTTSICSLRF